MLELFGLLAMGAFLRLWWANRKAYESAKRTCTTICHRSNVELLDDTVSLSKIKLARQTGGRLVLQRVYAFDYSTLGHNRKTGFMMMTHTTVDYVRIEPEDE